MTHERKSPLGEDVLRRYRRADGTLDTPIEEIVRIEENFKLLRHDPSRQDHKHWDGKFPYQSLPF